MISDTFQLVATVMVVVWSLLAEESHGKRIGHTQPLFKTWPVSSNSGFYDARDRKGGVRTRSSLFKTHTGIRSIPVFPQWHVKGPGRSDKSAGGRIHLNTHTPLTQRSRSGLTVPLSGHSVGTDQETSSHATRQGRLGHSRLSSLSHYGLILA